MPRQGAGARFLRRVKNPGQFFTRNQFCGSIHRPVLRSLTPSIGYICNGQAGFFGKSRQIHGTLPEILLSNFRRKSFGRHKTSNYICECMNDEDTSSKIRTWPNTWPSEAWTRVTILPGTESSPDSPNGYCRTGSGFSK